MRTDHDPNRTDAVRQDFTHDQMKRECSFRIKRMFLPIQEHERSVKALINKILVRLKDVDQKHGLTPRRVEKLWRGYVTKPNAKEHSLLGTAYQRWLDECKASGFAAHEKLGADHAENLRAAADYSASRWQRACVAGRADRDMGAEALRSAAEAD